MQPGTFGLAVPDESEALSRVKRRKKDTGCAPGLCALCQALMKPVMLMILLTISIVTFFPRDRRNCLIISWLLPTTISLPLFGVNGRGRFLILQNVINLSIVFLNYIPLKKKSIFSAEWLWSAKLINYSGYLCTFWSQRHDVASFPLREIEKRMKMRWTSCWGWGLGCWGLLCVFPLTPLYRCP